VCGTAFAQINGMDPDFFFYAEGADLMVRLKAAGFVTSLVREAYVEHRKSSDFFSGRWGGHSGNWAPGYTAPDFTIHR
jgi:GT2 family glycosyltransferase